MSQTGTSGDQSNKNLISEELWRYRPCRRQRYTAVNVLLVTWKEDDMPPGVADEVDELERVFRYEFTFLTWPYKIPSENSQAQLQLHVAKFIQHCASEEGNLVILYYSGHGGRTVDRMSSECIWSAKSSEGPWLDWAIIQPLFFGANCDVAIFLDCCFAGQAVRARMQHSVEFLAATDKDQFAPTGQWANRPSFTKVLTQELIAMLRDSGTATIPDLHRRMLRKETGLVKQPFYVMLSQNSSGAGICLAKWEPPDEVSKDIFESSLSSDQDQVVPLDLRVSIPYPLDITKREVLLRWMTRDSERRDKDEYGRDSGTALALLKCVEQKPWEYNSYRDHKSLRHLKILRCSSSGLEIC